MPWRTEVLFAPHTSLSACFTNEETGPAKYSHLPKVTQLLRPGSKALSAGHCEPPDNSLEPGGSSPSPSLALEGPVMRTWPVFCCVLPASVYELWPRLRTPRSLNPAHTSSLPPSAWAVPSAGDTFPGLLYLFTAWGSLSCVSIGMTAPQKAPPGTEARPQLRAPILPLSLPPGWCS